MPLIPFPPRCWLLKLSVPMRLMYPTFVMVIMVLVSGIRSSMDISNSSYPICVFRSSPYFSAMARISVRITVRSFFSSASMDFSSVISAINSLYSFSSFSLSRPVRAFRRISTIACACASDNSNRSIRAVFASGVVRLPLMIAITSSILSSAIIKPCKICARSSALFKSYFVRLVITSFWCIR